MFERSGLKAIRSFLCSVVRWMAFVCPVGTGRKRVGRCPETGERDKLLCARRVQGAKELAGTRKQAKGTSFCVTGGYREQKSWSVPEKAGN